MDLIIFTAGNNFYAMNLETIERIIQLPPLTPVPNAHPVVSEMMSYEGRVIKIIDFRKLVGIATYEEELISMFEGYVQEHKVWFDALSESVTQGDDPRKNSTLDGCELGQWCDSFISYDEELSAILKSFRTHHKKLHHIVEELMQWAVKDKDTALLMLQTEVYETYNTTMKELEVLIAKVDVIAATLQKLLVTQDDERDFAIKVDAIVDIISIDEKAAAVCDSMQTHSELVQTSGVIEHDGMLINIIDSVTMPVSEGV